MAYARPATVRSHRRGGPRRRLAVAPWIIVSLVLVLVASGLTVGYVWLVRQSCSGEAKATIVASPGTAQILQALSREWSAAEPSIEGTCAAVDVRAKDSAEVATALQNAWDDKVNGPPPDAWVPQSTAWVRKAANDADAELLIPDRQPSIARSPTVIAMPKPMAEKLGWPNTQLSWQDVINKFADKRGWAGLGEPAWGPFRFGMTDPATSTAGLLALTAILDANDDEQISDEEQQNLFKLKQVMSIYAERTDVILSEYAKLAQTPDGGLTYVSAFPALEQDVLNHNLRNPRAPLVAIYPNNGTIEADHPFLVMQNTPWSRPLADKVAADFMSFVRGAIGERQLLDAGFRDPNRVPGKDLTAQNGLAPQITALPRAVLLPESVARAVNMWTAVTRPANVLLVMDISGSMLAEVPGSGRTRLDLAKQAARDAVALFPDDSRVGLWVFSSGLSGSRDYRVSAAPEKLGETVNGQTQRAGMLRAINNLAARGDTGLYDSVAAAQKSLLDGFQKDALNLVVVMTDGKNEDPTGGLSFDQLKTQLVKNNEDANRRVPVTTVGFGDQADYPALQEISRLTGGLAFESREAFDINKVLLAAIFS